MQLKRTHWMIAACLAIVIGGIAMIAMHSSNPVEYFGARVERGDIRDVVDVTATANAVRTVQVGSQVSGTVSRLYVDFNSHVHKGELLALIEPSLLQGALQQAVADLESAQANLTAAEANVDRTKAAAVQTRGELQRVATLAAEHLATQQEMELAQSNYDAAAASVAAAVANVAQARAQIKQKDAAVAIARTNVDHTVIRSPIDGIVVARNVDVGQTVAASLQAPTIFTIAQDLSRMQLYAKADESDVSRIKVGAQVTFKVDAFPKETFTGKVSQIRMNATTVQNVVTYDAIIDFDNLELKIFPGMTAYVTVPVATVQNALKVPNGALRYNPPLTVEEIRALYAKYRIDIDQQLGPVDRERASDAPKASMATAAAPRLGRARSVVVWKLQADKTLMPVQIALGLTDHAYTEVTGVLRGTLGVGDEVVTGSLSPTPSGAPGNAARR